MKKFGPEATAKIIARLEIGVSMADAAVAAGIKPATAKSWLAKGRREATGPYSEFAEAVREARQAARERPDPMDESELARVVSEMARAGSVQAAKLRFEMLRAANTSRVSDLRGHDLLDEMERGQR